MQYRRSTTPGISGIVFGIADIGIFIWLSIEFPSWDFNRFKEFGVGPFLVFKSFAAIVAIVGLVASLTLLDRGVKLEVNDRGILDHRVQGARLIAWKSVRNIRAEIVNRGQAAQLLVTSIENGEVMEHEIDIAGLSESPKDVTRLIDRHWIQFREKLSLDVPMKP